MKPRDAIRSLLDAGFIEVNVRGGKHRKFHHQPTDNWITLPHSPKGDTYYGGMAHNVRAAVEKVKKHCV